MIEQYQLVEWDVHHGTLYGLPKSSLDEASKGNGIPVIRTESNGARTLKRNLQGLYNILLVGVVPDSYEQTWERLVNDESLSFDGAVGRFTDSIEMNNALPELADFYLHNSIEPIGDKEESKRRSSLALRALVLETVLAKNRMKITYSTAN
jgi:guanylate kinase